MAISIENLKDRYIKANEALDVYGLTLSDKIATGNTDSKMLRKFNLMSAWISFLNGKIMPVVEVEGRNPKSITIPTPVVSEIQSISIGIDNNKGEYTPIIALKDYQYSALTSSELIQNTYFVQRALSESQSYSDYSGITLSETNNLPSKIVINFGQTSDYNDQPLVVSPNIVNRLDYEGLVVRGGVTASSSGSSLSIDTIELYNSVLEDMAIELKISY